MGFCIFTDTACDFTKEYLDELNIRSASLTYIEKTAPDKQYDTYDFDSKAFYSSMENGVEYTTSAVSYGKYIEEFKKILDKGEDILYIGFSSGLSSSYQNGFNAASALKSEYPDRNILCVDSLAASLGLGMLVKIVSDKKNSGASIFECRDYAEEMKLKICHWFTVDDLEYLKRGGRISAATAAIGGLLGIKPVMHTDNEGHLTSVSKARGKIGAFKSIVEKYEELVLDKNDPVYIVHSMCKDDVDKLTKMLNDAGTKVELVGDIGPVIGAHTGPGTIGLFFIGKER